ncbi:bacteriocin fulvocin C-related protein [Kribbella sp. NBC_01505]|uniref:bacteriocin fulvocin C-related protein n=1 Tax=Kribbella sp. NBC_01505 TaxID=2903580 RepID=UPI00386422CA
MSEVVTGVCSGRLEVAPLLRDEVLGWRRQALGSEPRDVPTLIRVDANGQAQAWTGPRMLGRLVRVLGLRDGLLVLRALGVATRPTDSTLPIVEPGQQPAPASLGRKDFLKVAVGTAVAASVVIGGRTPKAFATPADQQIEAWMARNASNLPTAYREVVALPDGYRHAIYARTPVAVRRRWWADQLTQYRSGLSAPTPEQAAALDRAKAYLNRTDALTRKADPEIDALGKDFDNAFGPDTAGPLLNQLGPLPETTPAPSSGAVILVDPYTCECSKVSPYCSAPKPTCRDRKGPPACQVIVGDCGKFWNYDCDGVCG